MDYKPQALVQGGKGEAQALGARLWLEMRRDGGCWTRVPGDPIQRGSHRRLHRIQIHPCQVRHKATVLLVIVYNCILRPQFVHNIFCFRVMRCGLLSSMRAVWSIWPVSRLWPP